MEASYTRWIAPLIACLIVVGIFIFWAWGQMQELPIVHEGTDEKARFMRYLSCAAAMCGAWHQTDSDACESGEVISQPLEFEGEHLVKGCKELCEELRDDAKSRGVISGPQEHYCGENFAFQFTFNDKVNFTSLDIRNLYKFKDRVIHKSCYICPGQADLNIIIILMGLIPTGKPYYIRPSGGEYATEGYLMGGLDCKNTGYGIAPGLIWVPNNFAVVQGNCKGVTSLDDMNSYGFCEFNSGNNFWIWGGGPKTESDTHKENYWEWGPAVTRLFTSCGTRADLFGTTYYCPQIFMLDTGNPLNNCPP